MNRGTLLIGLGAGLVLGAVGYGVYRAGVIAGQSTPSSVAAPRAAGLRTPQKTGDMDPQTGKKVLYWHDPMAPAQRFDHPGKSPFMDMQLVPVEEGAEDGGAIEISPRVQQNLGVRVAEVTLGKMDQGLSAPATVAYDERDVALVQARANGFVERLYVRATLDPVRKGQPLADLYVPDWVAGQEEYLAVKQLRSAGAEDLLHSARERLRLAGMTEDLIERFEASGKVQPLLTLTAPISGVVADLAAREGMTLTNGAPLLRINGIATVWINAEVPESLVHQVRLGEVVRARTSALPGVVFAGKVSAVLPAVTMETRTVKVRVELANPNALLVPGMFATVQFSTGGQQDVLQVPSEAVIQTGTRSVVMLAEGWGKFRPVNVEVGSEGGGRTEIRAGLAAGQQVVVSGQFLIDSEASLKGTEARLR